MTDVPFMHAEVIVDSHMLRRDYFYDGRPLLT